MNLYEQIEAYISNALSPEERADFERQLAQDPEIKKAYDDWLYTEAVVQKHETAEKQVPQLRALLEPLTKAYFDKQPAVVRRTGRVRKLMLAAVAVAAVFVLFILTPAGIDRYPVTPMPNVVVRGAADHSKEGGQLFNAEQYPAALPHLKAAAEGDPEDVMAAFYYGVCLLKTEQPAAALPVFEKLLQSSSVYQEDSYFFAALCAYKTSNRALAEKYATAVPKNNVYYKNAQRILKKLK
ncbi:tetratricopeptide repeat protein [Niabella drilacis]|uniref:Tetratricopeptide repeat-containing protein n=1 Tax=Niabella drilacis (strain DSM 25811 / CCM 8410 / CCUG 62505 / LMG 26954 / E90) TaxID=1285928 RepID=A0A1G7ADN5_NIADE|nr:tetratricopeptide repeat protein [Niabella drilacis]SDE12922.1 Tetratricopeptide repeat-containing protein [Niabella drilacis]